MRNIAVLLQYKGSAYHGWQRQENAVTVQEVMENAIKKSCGASSPLYGCGRTDAGVHALSYVCNFSSETKIPDEKISYALNCLLPDDIRVLSAKTVPDDFHSRYSIKKKSYKYKILNTAHGDVFQKDLAWHYRYALDFEKMKKACPYFLGEHDFSAFCAAGAQTGNFIRTVYSLSLTKNDSMIEIDICGNGFLYNMVRIIVGTLCYVGDGRIDVCDIKAIIDSCDRTRAGITAPAHGLYMSEAEYNMDLF